MTNLKEVNKTVVEEMFGAGLHFGYAKSKRHPSTAPYIFGLKNKVEIFDLEKTSKLLEEAAEFVKKISGSGKQILFVTSKREAISIIKDAAMSVDQPYVIGRWIGGTLTNFEEIQKRVKRLEDLTDQKEKGLLGKYTKKERLLIDREIEKLEDRFGGITKMKTKPGALFVIDDKHEDIAIKEAINEGIPVVSLSNSDCNISRIDYPIPANDSSVKSISYITGKIVEAFKAGIKKV